MNKSTRILAVLILLATSQGAGAVEINVGGRPLTLPVPAGYTELTPAMSPYYETMRAYVTPTNIRYATLIRNDQAAAILRGEEVELTDFMAVETAKNTASTSVSNAMFDEFRGAIRTQLNEIYEQVGEQVPDLVEQGNERMSETFDANIEMSIESMVPLPVHLDTSNAMAYSQYVTYAASVDGQKVGSDVVASSIVFLHAKDRVLFLYVYGAESDLEKTRQTAADWISRITAANPVSGDVQRAVEAPRSGGINWGSVLEKAAIGALIGGIIGLFSLFRRRGKQE